jgi:hypothetical protein
MSEPTSPTCLQDRTPQIGPILLLDGVGAECEDSGERNPVQRHQKSGDTQRQFDGGVGEKSSDSSCVFICFRYLGGKCRLPPRHGDVPMIPRLRSQRTKPMIRQVRCPFTEVQRDLYDYTDPDRLPAAETTCVHYLSLGEFAERANISVNTMKGYRKDGRLPGEDGEVGRNRGWLPETADEWIAALAR